MKQDYKFLPPRLDRGKQGTLHRYFISLKSTFGLDLFAGLKKSLRAFFSKKVTIHYPLESAPLSPRYRAIHKLQKLLDSENERCIGCGLCEKICTSNCIRIISDMGEDGRKKTLSYTINFGRCIYCGLCAEVCPEIAIVHGDRIENSASARAQYGDKSQLLVESSGLEFGGFGSVAKNFVATKTPHSYGKIAESNLESSLDSNISLESKADSNATATNATNSNIKADSSSAKNSSILVDSSGVDSSNATNAESKPKE